MSINIEMKPLAGIYDVVKCVINKKLPGFLKKCQQYNVNSAVRIMSLGEKNNKVVKNVPHVVISCHRACNEIWPRRSLILSKRGNNKRGVWLKQKAASAARGVQSSSGIICGSASR